MATHLAELAGSVQPEDKMNKDWFTWFLAVIMSLVLVTVVASADTPSAKFQDGTVIILENGNYLSLIRSYTNSNFTHVAIIFNENGVPYVYEASQPAVKRYKIKDYAKEINSNSNKFPKLKVHFLVPKKPYTKQQIIAMKAYADSQIGRKFGVNSYLTGKEQKTIHCGEYVSNILKVSGRFKSDGPLDTPKKVYEKASKL